MCRDDERSSRAEVLVLGVVPMMDEKRTPGMHGEVLAHGTEQQAGEAATATRADDDKIGLGARLGQPESGRTLDDVLHHVDRAEIDRSDRLLEGCMSSGSEGFGLRGEHDHGVQVVRELPRTECNH
jgi:hypothetical protein